MSGCVNSLVGLLRDNPNGLIGDETKLILGSRNSFHLVAVRKGTTNLKVWVVMLRGSTTSMFVVSPMLLFLDEQCGGCSFVYAQKSLVSKGERFRKLKGARMKKSFLTCSRNEQEMSLFPGDLCGLQVFAGSPQRDMDNLGVHISKAVFERTVKVKKIWNAHKVFEVFLNRVNERDEDVQDVLGTIKDMVSTRKLFGERTQRNSLLLKVKDFPFGLMRMLSCSEDSGMFLHRVVDFLLKLECTTRGLGCCMGIGSILDSWPRLWLESSNNAEDFGQLGLMYLAVMKAGLCHCRRLMLDVSLFNHELEIQWTMMDNDSNLVASARQMLVYPMIDYFNQTLFMVDSAGHCICDRRSPEWWRFLTIGLDGEENIISQVVDALCDVLLKHVLSDTKGSFGPWVAGLDRGLKCRLWRGPSRRNVKPILLALFKGNGKEVKLMLKEGYMPGDHMWAWLVFALRWEPGGSPCVYNIVSIVI